MTTTTTTTPKKVDIAPGVWGWTRSRKPQEFVHDRLPCRVLVTVRLDAGRYVCDSFTVALPEEDTTGATVNATLIHGILTSRSHGVEHYVREAAWRSTGMHPRKTAAQRSGAEPWGGHRLDDGIDHLGLGDLRRSDPDLYLRWVAQVYRIGYAIDARPLAYVQQILGLASSSASYYIARARDCGYITESKKVGGR